MASSDRYVLHLPFTLTCLLERGYTLKHVEFNNEILSSFLLTFEIFDIILLDDGCDEVCLVCHVSDEVY